MITLERSFRLLDSGYSLATVDSKKRGNFRWGENQTKQISKQEFERRYSFKGDGVMEPTSDIALITGFNGLEVIDIDLKVFPTLQEQNDFWHELYSCLKDNIDDFDLKFVVYKTRNQGYHILYRCNAPEGNTKIAVLKDMKQAVIESRGVGGYVIAYENKQSKLDYTEVQFISDRDRELLWQICRVYHFQPPQIEPPKAIQPYSSVSGVSTWTDYNNKVSIWDVIHDEFRIVRKLSKHTIILRNGATSATSGYIYHDSGCMFLFSTGTIYPHEKLISPFAAYTYKYHNGDFSSAAKALYNKGYGDRIIRIPKAEIQIQSEDLTPIEFPLDVFPKLYQQYILECKNTLHSSPDYMGVSLLWAISLCIGNTIHIRAKNQWTESAVLWMVIVGEAGIGKTPSVHNIIKPLEQVNSMEIKRYIKNHDKWLKYSKLTEAEKKSVEHCHKPTSTQFIVNDITQEALVSLHQDNPISVGLFKDELNGWAKDMNKYRAGSDKEFWLTSWSGKVSSSNRKTSSNAFVDRTFIPVLGGIQPSVLGSFYQDDNTENGFVDRLLLCYPDLVVDEFNDAEMNDEYAQWYSSSIISLFNKMRSQFVTSNEDGEIQPYIAILSDEAKKEWVRVFNEITGMQNSDETLESAKGMLAKMKSYIPRFSLILNTIDCFNNNEEDINYLLIKPKSVTDAYRLCRYFMAMDAKIKTKSEEINNVKNVVKMNNNMSKKDIILAMKDAGMKINKSELARQLGVSRRYIIKILA